MSKLNQIKRFFYGLLVKTFNDQFDDCIFIDECTVEIRKETYKKWHKKRLLDTENGSVGKPAHNPKVHVGAGVLVTVPLN